MSFGSWVKNLTTRTWRPRRDPHAERVILPLRSHSGVFVSEDEALKYSAVWACVRIISNTLATLPWRVYQRTRDGGKRLADSEVDWLLHRQANPETSAFHFRQTLVAHALLWGNGYAEIQRSNGGAPVWLWLIPPDRVTPRRTDEGDLFYEVRGDDGTPRSVAAEDMFHCKGLGFDGVVGYSPIRLAAQAVGLGLACEEFGNKFFGNGAAGGNVVSHPGRLSDAAYKRLKETFGRDTSGLANAHKVKILEEGMSVTQLSIPPDDAQFLETRKFQVSEICRWYGVPPHKVADLDRATFSNIEHQSIEWVQDGLLPWVVPLEQEADLKLFGRTQRSYLYSKIHVQGLLRGDAVSRAQYYRQLFDMGCLSPNDVLRLEDMNPVGRDGDKRFVQLNLTTLERAGEEPEPREAPAPEPLEEQEDREEAAE